MPLAGSHNYTVRRVPFPNRANAAALVANADGTFTIFLNTQFDDAALDAALRHELNHLEADDFRSALPIAEIEARAGAVELPGAVGELVPFFASETALSEWIMCQNIANFLLL